MFQVVAILPIDLQVQILQLPMKERNHKMNSVAMMSRVSRSLSEVLKYTYPKPSTLAPKRKVRSNPPTGAKRCRGQTMHDTKISPSDRVKQYIP